VLSGSEQATKGKQVAINQANFGGNCIQSLGI